MDMSNNTSSDTLDLQLEEIDIHAEGLFSWLGDKFAELITGDSEWVAVDFDIPDLRYDKHFMKFECIKNSNNRTLKMFMNAFIYGIKNAIDEIKGAAAFYHTPKDSFKIIDQIITTWFSSLRTAYNVIKRGGKPIRKFRLPTVFLEKKKTAHEFRAEILESIYEKSKLYTDKTKENVYSPVYRVLIDKFEVTEKNELEGAIRKISEEFFEAIAYSASLLELIVNRCLECRDKKKLKLEEANVSQPGSTVNIEVTLPEQMDSVKETLDLYAYLILYLQQYKKDPHLTIGKIMDDERIPNREGFQDVKDGLVGAFTSEKAATLGCQKLVNLIDTTADKIRKDYVYLSNSNINSAVADVINNINSIINTTDPGMLEKRKLMYRQNNVTLKFGNYKLEKSIQPYIQELSASMNMVDYLKRIRELQHSLKLDTLKDLEEAIRKYKYNNVFINNNNAYIGKSQYMENVIAQDKTPPGEVSSLEAMKTFLTTIDISQDHDTVAIDILDNIIDNFKNTLSGLKRSVEEFNKLLNSIGESTSKLTDTLEILTDKYVKPYADNTLLKDEFLTGHRHCMQSMNNCLSNDKNIIIQILYNARKLNVLLNNYSYLYSLLEKLTIEMTITEKSSVSE